MIKVRWNYIIGIVSVISCTIIPLKEAFHPDWTKTATYLALDSMIYVMYFLDIAFTFNTTFVPNDGEEVFDRMRIAQNYMTGSFFIDLMMSIPYEHLYLSIKENHGLHR
jgi:hypothetical protein